MKLTIDNHDGNGTLDYSAQIDCGVVPRVVRKLNAPAQLAIALMPNAAFAVPSPGARIVLTRGDASAIFTGYLSAGAEAEFLGNGEQGPTSRFRLSAISDEWLLDVKVLPDRAPFVERTAGSAIKQLVEDLMPGGFDLSGVQDVDTIAGYAVNPALAFSQHAANMASMAGASYRAMNGAILLASIGAAAHALAESDPTFSPDGLALQAPAMLLNDITLTGLDEPRAYVRDYFSGDGLSRQFYLSQTPFAQYKPALIEENYAGATLDATTWNVSDPSNAISVEAQTLEIAGGAGEDGQTTVSFVELIELGGAIVLQHGDVTFGDASNGVLGGLYAGQVSRNACIAGFLVTPDAGGQNIQAIVDGAASGAVITTQAGHRYALTTYVYCIETYRSQTTYHSSVHPAGAGRGGEVVPADVRFVLEVHDIDPNDPSTWIAPATVLLDDVIPNAPAFAIYGLVNAVTMTLNVAATYAARIAEVELRAAASGSTSYVTQLVGRLADGAQCEVTSSPSLDFYPQYVPAAGSLVVASYRGSGRATAHVHNAASIAALQSGSDDGTRGALKSVKAPAARTSVDCENAALAMLDDGVAQAWSGTYRTWNDFLPGAARDIFPGEALAVSVASRGAVFDATVRQVQIEMADPANDRGMYTIEFANDQAGLVAIETGTAGKPLLLSDIPLIQTTTQAGGFYLPSLTGAQVAGAIATTVTIDAGISPTTGFGIEVRMQDFGWGEANDSNLIGRFSAQTFTVPRLARTQTFFLRLYDSSTPRKYSRFSAALHVDFPLT